jgi:hypothetical protein
VLFPAFFLLKLEHALRQKNPSLSLSQPNRVTRLGEFSPNEQLFTLGIFLKSTQEANIFVPLSSI